MTAKPIDIVIPNTATPITMPALANISAITLNQMLKGGGGGEIINCVCVCVCVAMWVPFGEKSFNECMEYGITVITGTDLLCGKNSPDDAHDNVNKS